MERAKEREVLIPIILKTSDCLWSEVLAVKRSTLSFDPYFIEEMLYEEGERYLVTAGIFKLDEYKLMYERLGGHIGSYQELWHKLKSDNDSIENSLEQMKVKASVLLHTCIFSKPDLDNNLVLRNLHAHNYSMAIKTMSATLKHLIDCNVLFFNGKKIKPQKNF